MVRGPLILRLLFGRGFLPPNPYERTTMYSFSFWKDAVERAVKTAAQGIVAAYAGTAMDMFSLDWLAIGNIALALGFLSLLTSLGSAPFGEKGTASLVK